MLLGGRIMMSAPVPLERRCISPSVPTLRPTSVRIKVTWTPMKTALGGSNRAVLEVFQDQAIDQAASLAGRAPRRRPL